MAQLNILAIILTLILSFIEHVEAVRFYYYSYYYTYYYYYSGYSLSPGDKGMIAGIVIGVCVITFLIIGCVYYCRSKATGSSGAVITSGQPAMGTYPPPVYPGMPMTTATSGAPYSQPPPYQPTDFQNVDSRSKTNLVHNEVVPR